MFEFRPLTQGTQKQPAQILIDPDSVVETQIDPASLICSICHHVVWNPVMCSVKNGCHTYFCKTCVDLWVASAKNKPQSKDYRNEAPCPNCKENLIASSPPPVLKFLLNNLRVKCLFSKNGCPQSVHYQKIQHHSYKECSYRDITCQGCNQTLFFKDFQNHTENCDFFMVQCLQCNEKMSKCHYLRNHTEHHEKLKQNNVEIEKNEGIAERMRTVECYTFEINNYQKSILKVETKVDRMNKRLSDLETLADTLLKGASFKLAINFQTGFLDHFLFPEPSLIKSSFNHLKNRNDFLHFYISTPIHLNSIAAIEWSLTIQRLKGNLLLGFCSSIGGESLDLIVNKYGEVKKKDLGQNKYKLIRKAESFMFGAKDKIEFVYEGRRRVLTIANRTRRVCIQLESECMDMFAHNKLQVKESGKECMYAFYSMDTMGDKLLFGQK